MDSIVNQSREHRTKLLALFSVLALVIILLVPFIISSLKTTNQLNIHVEKIKQVTSDIIYFDEILTNSARMYVFTQDFNWIKHYENHVTKLDETLAFAQSLDPLIVEAIKSTVEVNDQLVSLEVQAFELVQENKLQRAQNLLFSERYKSLKKSYNSSVQEALLQAKQLAKNILDEKKTSNTQNLISLFLLLSLALIGTLIYLFKYFHVTDMQYQEMTDRLRDKVYELEQSSEQLVNANKAKNLFLANMSHEIRTPINGIYGSLQLLSERQLPSDSLYLIDSATKSTQMLSLIVNDILDFSKIEANKLEIEYIDVDLTEVVNDSVSLFEQSCRDKGVELVVENHLSNQHYIADPLRLKQIIMNLLSNAIKFTSEGKVTLTLNAGANNHGVEMKIIDTGIGMNEKELSSLFTLFEQANNSISRIYGGTGLGMPIVQSLTKLMAGKLTVESEKHVGTTVTVNLPFKKGAQPIPVENSQATDWSSLSELNVLVAEDNKVNQMIIKAMLESIGCQLTLVENGKQAVEEFQNNSFNIVLMDINMPEMDGVEACKRIKKISSTIPIMAVTANALKEDVEHYELVGFDAVLGKPIEKNGLLQKMKDIITTS